MPQQNTASDRVEKRLLRKGLRPHWIGEPPAHFGGLTADSREARPGHLFVAVPGTRVDGHEFVRTAAENGASAAVVERQLDIAIPQLVVTDARVAVAHLAMLFVGDPGSALDCIGVTGTNGKSTIAWLVRWLLAAEESAAAIGTLGVVGADGQLRPGSLTTPDPIELAGMLAGLLDEGVGSVSLEVSSHALDQRRVDGLRFAAIAFASFSREHLEYHSDLETYRSAKLRLIDLMAEGGVCVINADEPAWREVDPKGARTLRYGFDATADVRAVSPEFRAGGTAFTLATPGGAARVQFPMPAEFNVQNALAAAAIAYGLGRPVEQIASRLESAPAVPGRMEVLRREPALVLRDYAHTPDSYERVLNTLRGLVSGRVIAVFGCGGDRDVGKRPIMGEIATRLADLTVVTTDNPRTEDPAEICRQVVQGLDPDRYEVVLDREAAIGHALREAGANDAVVLLGKGHETYQIIGSDRLPFDEAAIVAGFSGAGRS